MTREELTRILKFADNLRSFAGDQSGLASIDPRWNMISYAMQHHLEGKLLTVTSIAAAAEVPYGTAMRRIADLLDEGLLMRRSKSKTGKSFSLHPTRRLIEEVERYAARFKGLVGQTFGIDEEDAEDFFFGGYYMASRILSYPNAMRVGVGREKTIRILGPMDPTFQTLQCKAAILGELCGTTIEVTTLPLDQLHDTIIENHRRKASRYDIVAVDMPWIGELSEAGIIQPLDDIIASHTYMSSDFHASAWKGSAYAVRQYGIPIQPTTELLFCRSDLWVEFGLEMPRTTQDILDCAQTLHRAKRNLSGIVMNFGRGTPVAHTFVQTMSDFGGPIINLKRTIDGFDIEEIRGEQFRPMIDTDVGRETAEFLLEILSYSHPESLKCDWDRRIGIYSKGEAAMTYGWSIRAAAFELDEESPACRTTEFLPHPCRKGLTPGAPVGGYFLSLPSSLSSNRVKNGWKVMEYLCRPELMKWYVQDGNLTSPRFSTSADPEVRSISNVIRTVDRLEQDGQLHIWPRPPIPEFSNILAVLGNEIHSMLQGDSSTSNALVSAQNRIDDIMRKNGRY